MRYPESSVWGPTRGRDSSSGRLARKKDEMRKLPSTWSIIRTDNACWGVTTSAPVVFFIALMIKLTGTIPGRRGGPDTPVDPEVANMVLVCAMALILFLAAIVGRRVGRIRSLFDAGREVEASVRKVQYFRGARTKLELEFDLGGVPYKASSAFLRSSRTPAFSEGTRIPVLVHPANPKCAIPLALYADPGPAQSDERPISPENQSWVLKLKAPGREHRAGASQTVPREDR